MMYRNKVNILHLNTTNSQLWTIHSDQKQIKIRIKIDKSHLHSFFLGTFTQTTLACLRFGMGDWLDTILNII